MTKIEIDAILNRIEIRMAELGMSKETFYELSGISSASFSQWNTGTHKPTKKKLAQAAKILRVSLEYLLTGENENKPAPLSENEPLGLDYLRTLSAEQLLQIMKDVTQVLSEK